MPKALEAVLRPWIETFQSRSRLDLQSLWGCFQPDGSWGSALDHPWGARHRPDWAARGLIISARGGHWQHLRLTLRCPPAWRECHRHSPFPNARLVLLWWADRVELRVDGVPVHQGDLFDSACRWSLPEHWWSGDPLHLELLLRSPLHDDAALIHSLVELDPPLGDDPDGLAEEAMNRETILTCGLGHPHWEAQVRDLITAHVAETGSRHGAQILSNWTQERRNFLQVCPIEMVNRLSHPWSDAAVKVPAE